MMTQLGCLKEHFFFFLNNQTDTSAFSVGDEWVGKEANGEGKKRKKKVLSLSSRGSATLIKGLSQQEARVSAGPEASAFSSSSSNLCVCVCVCNKVCVCGCYVSIRLETVP